VRAHCAGNQARGDELLEDLGRKWVGDILFLAQLAGRDDRTFVPLGEVDHRP